MASTKTLGDCGIPKCDHPLIKSPLFCLLQGGRQRTVTQMSKTQQEMALSNRMEGNGEAAANKIFGERNKT